MDTIVNIHNLKNGIQIWHTRNWPQDFHNQLYADLAKLKSNGLNDVWWSEIVNVLWRWKAIRPLPRSVINERGLQSLKTLQGNYSRLTALKKETNINLKTCDWENLSGLFSAAALIKNSHSPVFGSKLCHFILPNAFPVIDHAVIGVGRLGYAEYWGYCKEQWQTCPNQQELEHELRQIIGRDVAPDYPWSTKLTELCIMGNRHS